MVPSKQLQLALEKTKELGMTEVLVTAADWKAASQRTIFANGGVYEDTRLEPNTGDQMKRYWIQAD